jgi:hypothetical protein
MTVHESGPMTTHTVSSAAVRSMGGFIPGIAHATGPGLVNTIPANRTGALME